MWPDRRPGRLTDGQIDHTARQTDRRTASWTDSQGERWTDGRTAPRSFHLTTPRGPDPARPNPAAVGTTPLKPTHPRGKGVTQPVCPSVRPSIRQARPVCFRAGREERGGVFLWDIKAVITRGAGETPTAALVPLAAWTRRPTALESLRRRHNLLFGPV